jgi:microcystin-dependent protein
MAYTIYKFDGTELATIPDGDVNTTSTNLTLPGPNFVGYGEKLNENLVYLLENFAGNAAPNLGPNLQGQLWFNKATQRLEVFTDAGYVGVSGITASSNQPPNPKDGDVWYNKTQGQSYIYDGSTSLFNLIGPLYNKAMGYSGAVPVALNDANVPGVTHKVIQFQFGNTVAAILSEDSAFYPTPAIAGFGIIKPGITLSNAITDATFNSNLLGNVTGNLVGNVTATTITGTLTGNVRSANAQITGGSATSMTLLSALTAIANNINVVNLNAQNIATANILITGGSFNGGAVTSTLVTTDQANITNVTIAGGSASLDTATIANAQTGNITSTSTQTNTLSAVTTTTGNLTAGTVSTSNVTAGSATINNFSTNNATIGGGSFSGISTIQAVSITASSTNLGNAIINGGSIQGVTTVRGGEVQTTNFSTANARVTGGNIVNTPVWNTTLTNVSLATASTTTKTYTDNSTALATTAFVQSVLPAGMIVMWAGSVVSIPTGWKLCDGTNGTPNLVDRFIVGAGNNYNPGDTGGNASVILTSQQMPVHTHSATVNGATDSTAHSHTVDDGGHRHTFRDYYGGADDQGTGITDGYGNHFAIDIYNNGDNDWDAGGIYFNTITDSTTTGIAVSGGGHTHNVNFGVTTATAGGNSGTTQAHENRPPYYALCYIQKGY